MLIEVAVPVPGLDLLTYSVPDGLRPPAGARVVVPLGGRVVTGIVVGEARPGAAAGKGIKPVQQVLDAEPFVPADVVELAKWTAEYYAAGPGEALLAVLPPKTRGSRADSHKTIRVASLTAVGLDVLAAVAADTDAARAANLTPKQREALELLAGAPTGLPTAALAARGFAADSVARLVRRGLVAIRADRVDRNPFGSNVGGAAAPSGTPRPLTAEQHDRLRRLASADAFKVALLHGVTGAARPNSTSASPRRFATAAARC